LALVPKLRKGIYTNELTLSGR